MKCEVHSSDLDVFINSLKRVADDVRSIPEEKGSYLILLSHFELFSLDPLTCFVTYLHVRASNGKLKQFATNYKSTN